MNVRTVQVRTIATLLLLMAAVIVVGRTPTASAQSASGRNVAVRDGRREAKPTVLECGDFLSFQVLLDRRGFSPGQIDGRPGRKLTNAIAAFQYASGLDSSGEPDCNTWIALAGDTTEPAVTTYQISEDDVRGPFLGETPKSLLEQAKLPWLGYRSVLESLGERFHASPSLLERLNRGVPFAAGYEIQVPDVMAFYSGEKPTPDPARDEATIQVTRGDSSLRVIRSDGAVMLFVPVTTGSEHDPLPAGDYLVTGVKWLPVFHYDPELFWDAKSTDEKAAIQPGPNNPVGVVWIALNLEHFGLHGTPEPGRIGRPESHGCVRMTNWDAARVAALVKPGTPVEVR